MKPLALRLDGGQRRQRKPGFETVGDEEALACVQRALRLDERAGRCCREDEAVC